MPPGPRQKSDDPATAVPVDFLTAPANRQLRTVRTGCQAVELAQKARCRSLSCSTLRASGPMLPRPLPISVQSATGRTSSQVNVCCVLHITVTWDGHGAPALRCGRCLRRASTCVRRSALVCCERSMEASMPRSRSCSARLCSKLLRIAIALRSCCAGEEVRQGQADGGSTACTWQISLQGGASISSVAT